MTETTGWTAAAGLRRAQMSLKYLAENRPKLRKDHADEFVAIADGKLVLAEPELEVLLKKLKERYGSTRGILVEYIPSEDTTVIV